MARIWDIFIKVLVVFILPQISTQNVDCNGKAFHCVNSTHFLICVDLGGGMSTTIDNYIIPCPIGTVCEKNNKFECDFPRATTLRPQPSEVTNEASLMQISQSTTTKANVEIFSITQPSRKEISGNYMNLVDFVTYTTEPTENTTEMYKSVSASQNFSTNVTYYDVQNNRSNSTAIIEYPKSKDSKEITITTDKTLIFRHDFNEQTDRSKVSYNEISVNPKTYSSPEKVTFKDKKEYLTTVSNTINTVKESYNSSFNDESSLQNIDSTTKLAETTSIVFSHQYSKINSEQYISTTNNKSSQSLTVTYPLLDGLGTQKDISKSSSMKNSKDNSIVEVSLNFTTMDNNFAPETIQKKSTNFSNKVQVRFNTDTYAIEEPNMITQVGKKASVSFTEYETFTEMSLIHKTNDVKIDTDGISTIKIEKRKPEKGFFLIDESVAFTKTSLTDQLNKTEIQTDGILAIKLDKIKSAIVEQNMSVSYTDEYETFKETTLNPRINKTELYSADKSIKTTDKSKPGIEKYTLNTFTNEYVTSIEPYTMYLANENEIHTEGISTTTTNKHQPEQVGKNRSAAFTKSYVALTETSFKIGHKSEIRPDDVSTITTDTTKSEKVEISSSVTFTNEYVTFTETPLIHEIQTDGISTITIDENKRDVKNISATNTGEYVTYIQTPLNPRVNQIEINPYDKSIKTTDISRPDLNEKNISTTFIEHVTITETPISSKVAQVKIQIDDLSTITLDEIEFEKAEKNILTTNTEEYVTFTETPITYEANEIEIQTDSISTITIDKEKSVQEVKNISTTNTGEYVTYKQTPHNPIVNEIEIHPDDKSLTYTTYEHTPHNPIVNKMEIHPDDKSTKTTDISKPEQDEKIISTTVIEYVTITETPIFPKMTRAETQMDGVSNITSNEIKSEHAEKNILTTNNKEYVIFTEIPLIHKAHEIEIPTDVITTITIDEDKPVQDLENISTTNTDESETYKQTPLNSIVNEIEIHPDDKSTKTTDISKPEQDEKITSTTFTEYVTITETPILPQATKVEIQIDGVSTITLDEMKSEKAENKATTNIDEYVTFAETPLIHQVNEMGMTTNVISNTTTEKSIQKYISTTFTEGTFIERPLIIQENETKIQSSGGTSTSTTEELEPAKIETKLLTSIIDEYVTFTETPHIGQTKKIEIKRDGLWTTPTEIKSDENPYVTTSSFSQQVHETETTIDGISTIIKYDVEPSFNIKTEKYQSKLSSLFSDHNKVQTLRKLDSKMVLPQDYSFSTTKVENKDQIINNNLENQAERIVSVEFPKITVSTRNLESVTNGNGRSHITTLEPVYNTEIVFESTNSNRKVKNTETHFPTKGLPRSKEIIRELIFPLKETSSNILNKTNNIIIKSESTNLNSVDSSEKSHSSFLNLLTSTKPRDIKYDEQQISFQKINYHPSDDPEVDAKLKTRFNLSTQSNEYNKKTTSSILFRNEIATRKENLQNTTDTESFKSTQIFQTTLIPKFSTQSGNVQSKDKADRVLNEYYKVGKPYTALEINHFINYGEKTAKTQNTTEKQKSIKSDLTIDDKNFQSEPKNVLKEPRSTSFTEQLQVTAGSKVSSDISHEATKVNDIKTTNIVSSIEFKAEYSSTMSEPYTHPVNKSSRTNETIVGNYVVQKQANTEVVTKNITKINKPSSLTFNKITHIIKYDNEEKESFDAIQNAVNNSPSSLTTSPAVMLFSEQLPVPSINTTSRYEVQLYAKQNNTKNNELHISKIQSKYHNFSKAEITTNINLVLNSTLALIFDKRTTQHDSDNYNNDGNTRRNTRITTDGYITIPSETNIAVTHTEASSIKSIIPRTVHDVVFTHTHGTYTSLGSKSVQDNTKITVLPTNVLSASLTNNEFQEEISKLVPLNQNNAISKPDNVILNISKKEQRNTIISKPLKSITNETFSQVDKNEVTPNRQLTNVLSQNKSTTLFNQNNEKYNKNYMPRTLTVNERNDKNVSTINLKITHQEQVATNNENWNLSNTKLDKKLLEKNKMLTNKLETRDIFLKNDSRDESHILELKPEIANPATTTSNVVDSIPTNEAIATPISRYILPLYTKIKDDSNILKSGFPLILKMSTNKSTEAISNGRRESAKEITFKHPIEDYHVVSEGKIESNQQRTTNVTLGSKTERDINFRNKKEDISYKLAPLVNSQLKNHHNFHDLRNESGVKEFRCSHDRRGKYADQDDCKLFYICIGRTIPIIGTCPRNTIYSEKKRQCTTDLAKCVRKREFKCTVDGRFRDIFSKNSYFICINNKKGGFARFKFKCLNDYYFDKVQVKCIQKKIKKVELESNSKDESSRSESEIKSEEVKSREEFECSSEGKFPHPNDCQNYYVCKRKRKVYVRRRKKCDSDEVFDRDKKKCVDTESYECKH